MSRLRGLVALVRDAVEHGSIAIEKLQKDTAARPFGLLAQIAPIAQPVKAIQAVHDLSVSGVHGGIRLVNRVVGAVADAALREESSPGAGEGPR